MPSIEHTNTQEEEQQAEIWRLEAENDQLFGELKTMSLKKDCSQTQYKIMMDECRFLESQNQLMSQERSTLHRKLIETKQKVDRECKLVCK